VTDPTGAVVPGATVRLTDVDRGIKTEVATGNSGFYTFADVRPGPYQMDVEKSGFKTLRLTGITINVQDNLEQNFKLALGSASETITVTADAAKVNTTDGTVSTVIDNRFVENMPLNGRSFSSLLELTPGVVLTPTNNNEQGQFSVNGQRPDANYFSVDGVSANLGSVGGGSLSLEQTGAGQLPATSAFGGLSNLVSLDALQEFRVQTSSFAPEYGRTPGAQVSVLTKSGTNTFHGTLFDYFRNDILDANDWYANNKDLKKAALRQNDFGGVLGGPVVKDKLFFFGSYEGLRVRQPRVTDAVTYVPSLASRLQADPKVQPLLNSFPKPTGGPCNNCPTGTEAFSASYSDPSQLDSGSARVDYALARNITVFGRYSDAPSEIDLRAGLGIANDNYSTIENVKYHTQTLTAGLSQAIGSGSVNELRFNYSRSRAHNVFSLDNFGGAVPPPESSLYPFQPTASSQNSLFLFFGDFNNFGLKFETGELSNNLQEQFNVTDNFSRLIGTHQLKFGMDYRRLNPTVEPAPYEAVYEFGSLANVLTNNAFAVPVISRTANIQLLFSNWGIFAQDTWKVSPWLTVTYGLRWEYNAVPSSPNGTLPFTVNQVNNVATTTLAAPGAALWQATTHDFAPRLGIAWNPRPNLVVRAGTGIFYDLGYSTIAQGMTSFPYVQEKIIPTTSFPLDANDAMPPPFKTTPPVLSIAVMDPNHVLPRTYEWNAAVEQSLSSSDVFTLTYVGAGGRKLMRRDIYIAPNSEFTGEFDVLSNHGTSNYNALQGEFRHRVSHGLQTLLSYNWAHSIDDVSSDANFLNAPSSNPATERASSDYDIRHTFSGAVSYDIPSPYTGVLKQIFGSWSTDSIVYVRSSPPVNVVTGKNPYPHTVLSGANSVQRPDVVPGVPFYLHPAGAPGGKIINAAAFTTPVPATAQGDLGRNALRGFGATQWDLTLRRQFRFTERFSLQFRGDFFNILNHPNFGSPINYLSSPQFGYATQMLNNYLGSGGQSGGLNPLYQIGGPRSIQLALKLQF
jgi:outer membrane receptor protein involved in Fe transport